MALSFVATCTALERGERRSRGRRPGKAPRSSWASSPKGSGHLRTAPKAWRGGPLPKIPVVITIIIIIIIVIVIVIVIVIINVRGLGLLGGASCPALWCGVVQGLGLFGEPSVVWCGLALGLLGLRCGGLRLLGGLVS